MTESEYKDISQHVVPHLNDVCQKALKNKYSWGTTGLEKKYATKYFGLVGSKQDEEAAGLELAKACNRMTEKFTPIGILGQPFKMELQVVGSITNIKSLYLVYFLFSHDDGRKIDEDIKVQDQLRREENEFYDFHGLGD